MSMVTMPMLKRGAAQSLILPIQGPPLLEDLAHSPTQSSNYCDNILAPVQQKYNKPRSPGGGKHTPEGGGCGGVGEWGGDMISLRSVKNG